METLVVGAGQMGRWVGRVARDALDAELAFLDRDPGTARAAADAVGGRTLGPEDLAESGDGAFAVVCIAVPIPATTEAIRTYGPHAREAVLDITGTMAGPVAAMADLTGCERASLHPLFAPDSEPGNVPVVVTQRGPTVDTLLGALEDRGNHVFETTPAEHDRAMETVQARTHAAVLAFALAAGSVSPEFHTPVSSELAALADRVTDGDARVYDDVQTAFDGAADVADAARRIADASGDSSSFERLYREAGGQGGDGDRGHSEHTPADDEPGSEER
jgi:prephenate dehydrogenase